MHGLRMKWTNLVSNFSRMNKLCSERGTTVEFKANCHLHFTGGAEGTLYCFNNYSYEIGKREVDKIKERNKELLETVNPNAMHLLGTAEEQVSDPIPPNFDFGEKGENVFSFFFLVG